MFSIVLVFFYLSARTCQHQVVRINICARIAGYSREHRCETRSLALAVEASISLRSGLPATRKAGRRWLKCDDIQAAFRGVKLSTSPAYGLVDTSMYNLTSDLCWGSNIEPLMTKEAENGVKSST